MGVNQRVKRISHLNLAAAAGFGKAFAYSGYIMSATILKTLDAENRRKEPLTSFAVGDTIKVLVKIKEGDKERVQAFSGIVIARKGSGATETFTVRRISFGEGVERIFPVHSPNIAGIEMETVGQKQRAKLYFLRKRSGKTARMATQQA